MLLADGCGTIIGGRMATFLLTWVPERYPLARLRDREIAATHRGESCIWSTGTRKKMDRGDRLFALKQGPEDPGVFGVGRAVSEIYLGKLEHERRDSAINDDETALVVDVTFDTLFEPDEEHVLPLELLKDRIPGVFWHPRGSGIQVPEDSAQQLEVEWKRHVRQIDVIESAEPPSEADLKNCATEGLRRLVQHLQIERNPQIVRDAKKHWYREGPSLRCSCRQISFREMYGDRGDGFIEAHHVKPLAELGESEQAVTRIEDLQPVCANCHRMLHKQPALAISGLSKSLKLPS
jgi:5-methylcytosine-specific restriction protein A